MAGRVERWRREEAAEGREEGCKCQVPSWPLEHQLHQRLTWQLVAWQPCWGE